MKRFYVVLAIHIKDEPVKYAITWYDADYMIIDLENSQKYRQQALKPLNIKKMNFAKVKLKFVYQNIETKECERYIKIQTDLSNK